MTFKTWINDLRDVQSVINNISNTRVIIDGATGLLNTNSLKEMSSAVSGLSKEQALLVLSTKNLNAAQQEQVLLAAGIISSENSITASAISQALAKTQLSATEKEALLTKLGLIDATTGEAIANATCTKEELLKVLATKGIIGADADAIISSIGLTSANSAQAISFDLLTASIWANIKALGKWLITNPVGWAILGGTAIFGLVKAYDALTDSVEEVQERTDKLLDSYNSAISEANSNAKTIESLADRYGELSKGVNNLGENVSLTSDEYSEYKGIVDQIAEMFPTLITGYTDEGTAILSLKGNVEKLRDAYKEAQTEAYNLLIVSGEDTDGNDIISNYKNQVNGNESWLSKQSSYIDGEGGAKDAIDIITKLTGALTPDEFRDTYNELYEQYKNIWNSDKIQDALKSSGFEELSHAPKWGELTSDDLAKVKSTAQATIQTYKAEIDSQLKNVDTLANAYLMTNEDYSKLDEQSQTAASLIVNSITEDIANGFKTKEDVGAYVANIVSKIRDNPDLNKSLVDLFTEDFSSMSVDEAKSKLDGYINTIAKVLNEDPVELKIRLGFDDYDDVEPLKTKVQGFLKDEFDDKVGELSLDDLQVASKLEIPEGTLLSWDELKQKIEETKNAASEESSISFTDALNSSEYTDIKEKLLDLAKSGEITSETLSSTKEYNALLEKVGISAESAKDQILDMLSVQERLAGATQGLSKLKSAYEEFKNKDIGFVTAETLESLPDVFKNLPDFDLFSKIVGNPESGKEKIQQAFNDIVKSYLADQETLQGLVNADSATIQTYIANLKQMGITNAEEVVRTANEALNSDNEMINAAEKEYNKYLKGKLKGGEKFLESTASNNSKLKNALGSTYKSDYDNWCDLLSNKADAYNEFVKAIGGSYDDSKNVAQNLAANNGAFGANEYAEAQAAYDKWKQTKKQADDLKNSLKLDYSQITTNFGTNWSPTTTKPKKTKSKTKSDAAEVFDFIEIKLNNLADKASKAKDKIDDLFSFNGKKNQTKKAIDATTDAIKAQKEAYKRYIAYANKAAKTQNNKKSSSSSTTTSTGGNALYDEATNYLGLKYVWGGASLTSGADCSGFTQQIYKKFGVSLPHHAADQAKMGTKITAKKDLQAGDLVFFGSKNNITHVGIYGGDGKFIESPHTGASVRVSNLSSRKDFVSGSRFSGISGSTTTTTSSGSNVKKVKGVSSKTLEHYKKLIRNGTLDADGIQTIKNENLKNALKDYQTWYEKAKACKEQVASLTDQLKDLYETLANNPIDSASDKIEKLGTKMDLLNSKVENAVVNADKKSSITSVNKLYKSIMSNYDSQLNASEKAYTTAKSNFSSSKKTLTKKFNKYSSKKLGLTSAELKTIKNNLKNNKKIPGSLINKLNKNGYFNLYKKCIAHNEYLDAYNTSIDNVRQAREDNKSNKRQTASDHFQKISGGFENKLSSIEHTANIAQANLDFAEATGHYATQKYYKDLLKSNQETMNTEQDKMNQLIKERDEFVKNGQIKKGDDAWQQMSEDIWQCAENIQSCKLNAVEFNNSLRDLEWEAFDRQEEYIERIIDEANFLIDIMDSKEKFDENGNITSYGKSIEGLHAVNANTYQQLANDKADEIARLDAEYSNDKYNKDYLERREELLEAHREAIKGYQSERSAIVNLVSDGYNAMSEALDKLIDKRKEALSSEKNLYDYQKSITEKTKSLAKLRKQLDAIQGDNSEETKAQIQKIKVSIEDAQSDLQDAEYNQWMSDQEELMDKVSDDFKDWIDNRLKNTDDIVKDVIKQTNLSTSEIKSTLETVTNENGTKLTTEMSNIFDTANGISGTVSDIWNGSDGVKTKLGDVIEGIKSVVEAINKKAVDESVFNTSGSSGSDNKNSSTSNSGSTSNNKTSTTTTNKTSSSTSSSSSSKTKTNAKWAAKYLKKKKFKGDKSKLNKNGSIVDRLKYFDFDSSESARAKFYKGLYKASYTGTAAQNNKLIAEMKKHGFRKGGEIGDLIKLTGEDGFVLARKGEGILTPENMETLRESIKISNATLSMINNLTKTPQIKPSNLNNTVNPTVNIGDIQVVANNPQEFAREFRNTVINDPKTQKMLSTFIGNQLTGGNSLEFKKYK